MAGWPGAASVRIGDGTFPVRDGVFTFVRTKSVGNRTVEEFDRDGRVLRTHR